MGWWAFDSRRGPVEKGTGLHDSTRTEVPDRATIGPQVGSDRAVAASSSARSAGLCQDVGDQQQLMETSPVAEYRYNGFGQRIAEHVDTEPDGDVDGDDPWHHFAYNEAWQMVAMFLGSDTDPTEEYLHHYAGDGGYGTASYIDDVVFRDRDTDANGSLDERIWYAQNWRHDVVVIVDDSGAQLEMARYSPYGVPFGSPGGDANSNGANGSADHSQILTWSIAGPYDVRGDMDLDGDVDSTDYSTASSSPFNGVSLGRGVPSMPVVGSRRGYTGHVFEETLASAAHSARRRTSTNQLGRWMQRDPIEYADGVNLYEYGMSEPIVKVDPYGTQVAIETQLELRNREILEGKRKKPQPEGKGWYDELKDSFCALVKSMGHENCNEGNGNRMLHCVAFCILCKKYRTVPGGRAGLGAFASIREMAQALFGNKNQQRDAHLDSQANNWAFYCCEEVPEYFSCLECCGWRYPPGTGGGGGGVAAREH